MATLIRIKRPLDSDPIENIVVKSKRQKTEGCSKEEEVDLPTGVLQRVATVISKNEELQADVLQAIKSRCRTGEELRLTYKRPTPRDTSLRDAMKQQIKDRATQHRQKLHTHKRGNLEEVQDEEEAGGENSKKTEGSGTNLKGREDKDQINPTVEPKDIKFYDIEMARAEDVITCNDIPLESEKYVYDIYYSQMPVDWTKFICEVERFEYPSDDDSDEDPDEDDENDEDNWRNDYPEEEEDRLEDEDEYISKMMGWRDKKYDTDESFDADEYDDTDDFDEHGNLVEYGQTNVASSLRHFMHRLTVARDDDQDDSDGNDMDKDDDDDE